MTDAPQPVEPTDEAITETLVSAPAGRWHALWDAVDALNEEREHARWEGGEQVDTTAVDGVQRPVYQMPYVIYSEAVNRIVQSLYELGAVVPFNWHEWEGVQRYRMGHGLEAAPVSDAVRLLTAIIRADRFTEGTIAVTLEDGTLPAALQRLRRWYVDERAHR
jgi:hypothetical protein